MWQRLALPRVGGAQDLSDLPRRVASSGTSVSKRTRSTVPIGRSTSLPSVATSTPPAPIRMPVTAPFTPPRMPPMMAPTPAPGADPPHLALQPLALQRLGDRDAHVVRAPVDGEARELERDAALSIGARRRVDRCDVAHQQRAGRDNQIVLAIEIDHRCRLDALLHLRRPGVERRLQPDVQLGVQRNHPPARRHVRAVGRDRWSLDEAIETLAELARLAIRHALALTLLDAQVGQVVLEILELAFQVGPFAGAKPGRTGHRGLGIGQPLLQARQFDRALTAPVSPLQPEKVSLSVSTCAA